MRVKHVGYLTIGIGLALTGSLGGASLFLAQALDPTMPTGNLLVLIAIAFGFLSAGARIIYGNVAIDPRER